MKKFSDRLKQLQSEHGYYKKYVAEQIGITLRAYQYYESEDREPTLSVLIALSDLYNVSLDYLVGRSDNPKRL